MIEKMKDSGIEWVGEIPEEWDYKKLKYIIASPLMYGANETGNDFDEHCPRYIRITDINENNYLKEEGKLSLLPEVAKPYLLEDGDMLFARSGATVGKTFLYRKEYGQAAFAGYLIKAHFNKDIVLPEYVYYSTLGSGYENWKNTVFTQATIQNIGADKYAVYQIPIPSILEQQVITDFLDKKVGQVDDVLADLNKQVEILNQYRDSVIYEATSKGLNKNNAYQNIDNEWYPQIPAHWRFMAVKRLTSVLTCGVASTPEYVDEDNGVLFLSAQNIQNNKLDLSIKKYIPISLHKTLTKSRRPEKGDILQVRVGATIGKCAIVDIDEEFSVYVSLSHIRVNRNMHNRFLNYIIGTDMFKEMVSLDIDYAGTQGNLNVADLREVRIPVPPIQEQEVIADYLDKKCAQIDELITDKQKQIEKMENYKKSLIYEYVTGKKRVRV